MKRKQDRKKRDGWMKLMGDCLLCSTVEYEHPHDVVRAMKNLNGSVLDGREIEVREDREPSDDSRPGRIFEGGFGRIERRDDRFGGRDERFFGGRDERFGGRDDRFGGRDDRLVVREVRDSRERIERRDGGFGRPPPINESDYGRQVYIHNLPFTTSWQDLKDLGRKCGNVIRADVAFYPDGAPKGAGTVLFETEQDAHRAIRELNHVEFQGRQIFVQQDKFVR